MKTFCNPSICSAETNSYSKFVKYSNEKEVIVASILKLIPKKSKRLLDIGAGNGFLEIALQNKFNEIVAIEPSENLFSKLNKLKIKKLKKINLKFEDYPKTKKFDTIISSYSIQYLENREKQLDKIKNILKDSGQFIVVKNKHSGKYYEYLKLFRPLAGGEKPKMYPDNSLIRDLKKAGFEIKTKISNSTLIIPSKKEAIEMSDFFFDTPSSEISKETLSRARRHLDINFKNKVVFEIPQLFVIATKTKNPSLRKLKN